MKIFLVDDDSDFLEFQQAILEAAGHTVLSTVDGAQAISQIRSERPDCVLTDLMMADFDGLELCREIRSKPGLKKIRIIVVSARTSDYWKERAREAGADGYIEKPLDPDVFIVQIDEILSGDA